MVSFKHFEVELLKVGKVSNHTTKAKIKEGKVSIQEVFSNIKGKGIMIFFPEKVRKKAVIGKGR